MLDVGEDVFHGSRDDTRLVVISRLERENGLMPLHLHEKVRVELTKVKVFPDAVCP